MKKKRAKPEASPLLLLVAGPLVPALLASIICGIWSVLPPVTTVLTVTETGNDRPARFVVEEVVYQSSRRGADRYDAKGRMDAQPEAFELWDVAPTLGNREALEKHVDQQPVSFAVMYNPDRMRPKRNDGTTRMLPARGDFAESYRNAAWLTVFDTLGSIFMNPLALTTLRWMGERPKRK